jgi:hypothetical protein
MRLNGNNGINPLFTDYSEKVPEGKVTITYREMFIKEPVIVMDMNLSDA